MRNGYTSFNRNDIVKHNYTDVISSEGVAEVEKSPAEETKTIIYEYPNTRPWRLATPRWLRAEKSPAVETARYDPAPAHSPAGAPCLARRWHTVRIISS